MTRYESSMALARAAIREQGEDQSPDTRPVDAWHTLSLLLAGGGDGRIRPDPATGRNRYGTRMAPAPYEIAFASTTASNVSAEGFLAADSQLKRLFGADTARSVGIDDWFASIRTDIAQTFGCGDADVILAASGTDVELLAICLTSVLSIRPLTSILIAPEETGSGVPRAAAGRHFSDATALGSTVTAGATLEGFSPERIEVRTIAIRNEFGQPRSECDIDADVIAAVEQELKRGRDVLVHVLDTSKTGLSGVSRKAARHVSSLAPGRVRVLVDACQFRCSSAALPQDLADGFWVAVTGSKFLAGPPFAGALLLPPPLAAELASATDFPAGLSCYTALHDWPASRRMTAKLAFGSHFNLGLGLRWVAALAQMDSAQAIDDRLQFEIRAAFTDLVRARIGDLHNAFIHSDDEGEHIATRAIVPLTITNKAGAFGSLAEVQKLHLALREDACGPICHVGQAVNLGDRTILRIAASALDINRVSKRLAAGQSWSMALEPIAANLDILFDKWAAISNRVRGV